MSKTHFLSRLMVSCLTFKCLIHFEFISIHILRKQYTLILLYVAVQFSQHHLLKRLPFSIVYPCLIFHRLIYYMCISLFLQSLFCSTHLFVYFFLSRKYSFHCCRFSVYFKIKKHDTPAFISFSRLHWLSGSFVFPYKFRIIFFYFCENGKPNSTEH